MSYNRRSKVKVPQKNRSKKFGVPPVRQAITTKNPLRSLGLAVHPKQAEEFNEYYRSENISGAYHDSDGTCVMESRNARNEVMKLRKYRDNDAGYGDWAGENT